jgi:glucosamine--fructose-6-phosphate aminotransferase (isomerizing)
MSQPGEIMFREINEIPQMLRAITNSFGVDHQAHSLLKDREFTNVVILARGTSDNAAHFFKYLIETKLGLPCGLASPSAATMYHVPFKYSKTLLIALSQSGRSTDLLTFAKSAQAGGGFLLSITNDAQSPLAAISDIHIPILAGPEIAVPATKSYVGQLMVSYLLAASWVNEVVATEEIITNAEDLLESDESVAEFARSINLSRPLFVLGRGFSYPNAKEFALKMQETCLVPVQGMSSSDFLHGPIASLSEDAQVVFMAPEHLPRESFGEAPTKIRTITKNLYWIGKSYSMESGEHHLDSVPSSSEVVASITDAVLFQKVTHHLATSNGLDPDSPRGLSKVTITR